MIIVLSSSIWTHVSSKTTFSRFLPILLKSFPLNDLNLNYENFYLIKVVPIQTMFNLIFSIKKVDDFVNLVWHSITKTDNFIVLTHLVKEVLRKRSKILNCFFIFATKNLQNVNNQGILWELQVR